MVSHYKFLRFKIIWTSSLEHIIYGPNFVQSPSEKRSQFHFWSKILIFWKNFEFWPKNAFPSRTSLSNFYLFRIETLAVPDIVERKGSLCLKSNHMHFGKKTLNSDWHAAREAEPKDYDVSTASDKTRDHHLATYKRIGFDEPTIPKSTMQAGCEEALLLRGDYESQKKTNVSTVNSV